MIAGFRKQGAGKWHPLHAADPGQLVSMAFLQAFSSESQHFTTLFCWSSAYQRNWPIQLKLHQNNIFCRQTTGTGTRLCGILKDIKPMLRLEEDGCSSLIQFFITFFFTFDTPGVCIQAPNLPLCSEVGFSIPANSHELPHPNGVAILLSWPLGFEPHVFRFSFEVKIIKNTIFSVKLNALNH